MKSRKTLRSSGLLVGIVLVAMLMMNSGVTQAAPSSSPALPSSCTWKLVSSPSPGNDSNYLAGVAAVSATDVMAVGNYQTNGVLQTLAEQWNGSAWSVVPTPSPTPDALLYAIVRIPGTKQFWAVGQYFDSSTTSWNTLILLWNNNKWSQVPSPDGGTYRSSLTGVTATSASDAWAVGNYYSGITTIPLAEHWNGTNWSVVSTPNPGSFYSTLTAVTAISAKDVWAVGEYEITNGEPMLAEHWNGTSWSVVTSPPLGGGATLYAVTRVADTDQVWAVGFYFTNPLGSTPLTLIEQWNGKKWSVISSPSPDAGFNQLQGITAISAKNVWAVGSYGQGEAPIATLVEHWNGSSWSVVPSPSPDGADSLYGVTHVPHTNKLWAVGVGNGTLTKSSC